MILQSIICILISIFAGLFTNKIFNINEIVKNNWSSFQCTTVGGWLYPFFGPSNISLADNEAQCNAQKFDNMFSNSIQGTNNNISSLTNVTNELNNSVNNIRNKISSMERAIFKDINNIWQKIWAIYYKIIKMFMILYTIIQKMVGVFLQLISIGAAAFYSFGSMWNGSVGNVSRFFCFHPNTPIKTINGYISIKNIKLGQKLSNNNIVKSIYKFNAKNTPLYNYKNIIVSGSHLVFENNQWIRVEDSKIAKPFKSNTEIIYCLNTSQNIIKTKYNIIFKDFDESNSKTYETNYYQLILNHLNNNQEKLNNINYNVEGFHKNTLIKTLYGYTPIYKINLNTPINRNNKVIGISKSYTNNYYKYKNTYLSGNNIIFENNKWILVSQSKFSTKINKKCILYHLHTNDCNIYTQYFTSKSFFHMNDLNIQKQIDNLI